jgi:hypothetical protein
MRGARQLKPLAHALLAATTLLFSLEAWPDRLTVPLDDPSAPAKLDVSLVNGSVQIVGARVDVVTIALDDDGEKSNDSGMKNVSKALRALKLSQKGNRVEISVNPSTDAEIELEVPLASSAKVSTVNGKIEVRGLTGELELHNTTGRIVANEVSGPVSASTVNGRVVAELSATPAREEMAFSTLNGDVDVTLPEGFGADLTLSSDNGSIYSDFELVVGAGEQPPSRRRVGKKVNGRINGGGPMMMLRTFNGDIMLHERKR